MEHISGEKGSVSKTTECWEVNIVCSWRTACQAQWLSSHISALVLANEVASKHSCLHFCGAFDIKKGTGFAVMGTGKWLRPTVGGNALDLDRKLPVNCQKDLSLARVVSLIFWRGNQIAYHWMEKSRIKGHLCVRERGGLAESVMDVSHALHNLLEVWILPEPTWSRRVMGLRDWLLRAQLWGAIRSGTDKEKSSGETPETVWVWPKAGGC